MRSMWKIVLAAGSLFAAHPAAAQPVPQAKPSMGLRTGTEMPKPRPKPVAIPLPKPRPFEAKSQPASNPLPQTQPEAGTEPPEPSACFVALTTGLAQAEALPPIVDTNGCEAPDVVRLDAVMLPDRRRITLSPPAVLRCSIATSVAHWVRDDLLSAVAAFGGQLSGIDNFDSFDCRGRNRVVGAKMSEHGRANALDIRALLLSGGRRMELTNPEIPREFRDAVRVSACMRFTTVLGPGSDGYHEDHVHVDLAERRNGFRLCQWDVRDRVTPLPRERPAEAGLREPQSKN